MIFYIRILAHDINPTQPSDTHTLLNFTFEFSVLFIYLFIYLF